MILQDIQNILDFSLTTGQVITNLLVALACGLIISLVYRKTYRGPNYSRSYVNSLVLLSIITSIVIVVIGNNLARAFGLVGAMSIIRFRTPIKDAQDIVFIFFSLAVGLAAGVGLYKVAVVGTLFVGAVIVVMANIRYGAMNRKEYLLQFSYEVNAGEEPTYMPVLDRYCKTHKLINVRSIGSEELIELSFYIRIKDEQTSDQFVKEIRSAGFVKNVNLFFDNDNDI